MPTWEREGGRGDVDRRARGDKAVHPLQGGRASGLPAETINPPPDQTPPLWMRQRRARPQHPQPLQQRRDPPTRRRRRTTTVAPRRSRGCRCRWAWRLRRLPPQTQRSPPMKRCPAAVPEDRPGTKDAGSHSSFVQHTQSTSAWPHYYAPARPNPNSSYTPLMLPLAALRSPDS